jgi:hypothetical protein
LISVKTANRQGDGFSHLGIKYKIDTDVSSLLKTDCKGKSKKEKGEQNKNE